MIAVGLDPSLTCTGVALIDTTTGETRTRRVMTAATGKDLASKRRRIREAITGILSVIPARLGVTVIEIPNSRQQYGALPERHALTWWLIDQLLARGPVVDVSPSARAKLATGNGRADKKTVLATVRAAHPTVTVQDDNVADALALAAAGAHWLGHTQTYTPDQAAAYARITWP